MGYMWLYMAIYEPYMDHIWAIYGLYRAIHEPYYYMGHKFHQITDACVLARAHTQASANIPFSYMAYNGSLFSSLSMYFLPY